MPRLTSALSALLALPLAAQGDYDLDRGTPATLGGTFRLDYAGAPAGTGILLLPSTNTGPFPLALISPGDTRSLEVGVELSALWLAATTGTGSGSYLLPLPPDTALHALVLQLQSLTLPGNPFLVDRISNRVSAQLGLPTRAAALPGALTDPRALAVSTAQDGNGEVVVAGGGGGSILNPIGLASSEIFDVRTLTPRPGPRMTVARALAAGVTLGDGTTLLCGGVDTTGTVLASAELYDPATRTFVAVGSMARPRALHSAALLPDGRVLVAGGTTILSDPVQALVNSQSSAEIYDPAARTWSPAASMARRLLAPGLHALGTGRILVSGGFEVQVVFGLPIPIGSISGCQLYDPGANSWGGAASMRASRAVHQSSSLLLPDGRLLVTGGAVSGPDLTMAQATATAELYSPAGNTWTALPAMARARLGQAVHVLGSGSGVRAVVAGGADGSLQAQTPLALVQALDPTTGQWATWPDLTAARAAMGSAVTADGTLVLIGGQGAAGTLGSLETLR